MSQARTAILARLSAARRTAVLPPVAAVPRRPAEPASPEQRLRRFREELTALGVDNHLEAAEGDVRRRVSSLLEGRRVLSWDPELLPYAIGPLLVDPVLGRSPREEQARAEVGLTGCDAAIAETGSLVLFSGKGRSRAVSLLPPLHVAVVRPNDVYSTMGEFFAASAERQAAAACCTVITGPSRTADIELTLTLGVHGPGRVVVVVGP